MGNAPSITYIIDLPVCDGGEPSIRVKNQKLPGDEIVVDYRNIIHYPELSCPMAAECLRNFDLPANGGHIRLEPKDMENRINRVHTCVVEKIKALNSAPATSNAQGAQPPPATSNAQDAQPPRSQSTSQPSSADPKIKIITSCDGQFRENILHHPDMKNDGFFIVDPSRPSDIFSNYNSLLIDKLTCKEAIECMNNLEMVFNGEARIAPGRSQSVRYLDTKGRSVDELRNSIRTQCVEKIRPPSSPSTPDLIEDASGVTSETDTSAIVLIVFGVVIMIAIPFMLYLLLGKRSNYT